KKSARTAYSCGSSASTRECWRWSSVRHWVGLWATKGCSSRWSRRSPGIWHRRRMPLRAEPSGVRWLPPGRPRLSRGRHLVRQEMKPPLQSHREHVHETNRGLAGRSYDTVGVVAFTAITSRHTTAQEAAPIFVTKIPPGYRDWKVVSVAHEEGD